ncbi:MAG: redoxin domain-containing protein [Acidobacteria bacterium]|nr:redoxin domain-containing protein [Acidobacteriota bacterium]
MKRLVMLILVFASLVICAVAADSSRGLIQPAEPKWGDKIQIIYRIDSSGTPFRATDRVVAFVRIWSPGDNVVEHRFQLSRVGDHLQATMTVPESASFLLCYFVTANAYDGPVYTMFYTRKGLPARGAWLNSMTFPHLQKDYIDRAKRELELYPDNWEVYVQKWFCAGAFDAAEQKNMIRAELPQIEKRAAGRPVSALYSMVYGNLWLDHEEAARAILQEMVKRFPNDSLTAGALNDYLYQNFIHHFPGDGPTEAGQALTAYCRRNPRSYWTRNGLDSIAGMLLPLGTKERICKLWIQDDPSNPTPYMRLSEADLKNHVNLPEALRLSEKALDLLVAGQLRLHGDILGKMTELYLPLAYLTAAKLARREGQYAKALAYAKAGEALSPDTQPSGYEVEAQIWEALGRAPNEKAALIEAWKRGSQSAHQKLAENYPEALKNTPVPAAERKRKDAPAFHGTTLDGHEIDSTQLRGKIIVGNFWYTGCGPCVAEIPSLDKLVKKFQDRGVVFLAFDIWDQDNASRLRPFLKEYPFDYTIVLHAGAVAGAFGIHTFPSHVIIGRDGKIEAKLMGGQGESDNVGSLETTLSRLVESK